MKFLSLQHGAALMAVALTFGNGAAQAGIAYNTNGWDSGDFPGASGFVPGTWTGGGAPAYSGKLNAVWYADLAAGTSETVSSANGVAAGADPLYELAVGPMGWQRNPAATYPHQGMGHGSDIGLITLDTTTDLTITVAADSDTPLDPTTVVKPGFSLFQGWDTGTTANQVQAYYNNLNNPLGSVGLTYLNGAGAATGLTSISLVFSHLAAGNYTLILGGNAGGGHGAYSVAFFAAPVPLPGAVWLFGSVLVGLVGVGRRNGNVNA